MTQPCNRPDGGAKVGERKMLIKNYGLYWNRDDVFWGWQNYSGHLLGYPGRKKTKVDRNETVDFRGQAGFYALQDDAYNLVYVGQVGSGEQTLLDRLRQHKSGPLAKRWSYFSWFGFTSVKKDGTLRDRAGTTQGKQKDFLNQVEAVLIAVSEPPKNKRSGHFGKAEKYHQYLDENLALSQEDMIREIYESLTWQENEIEKIHEWIKKQNG